MERQWVTPEEAEAIWHAATKKRDELYIKLLFYTGGRSTEVSSIRPMDIGKTYVVLNNLKQHQEGERIPRKMVQVPEFVIEELIEYIKQRNIALPRFIFSDGGIAPMSNKRNWTIVQEASRRAGVMKVNRYGDIKPAWPYCFRHGNAQLLYNETHDVVFVQQQLGHASLRTTEKYIGVTVEQKREYVRRIFKKVEEEEKHAD